MPWCSCDVSVMCLKSWISSSHRLMVLISWPNMFRSPLNYFAPCTSGCSPWSQGSARDCHLLDLSLTELRSKTGECIKHSFHCHKECPAPFDLITYKNSLEHIVSFPCISNPELVTLEWTPLMLFHFRRHPRSWWLWTSSRVRPRTQARFP